MNKLSVCVLIYNSKQYINRCMSCLLNQTDKNFEIVLINNASTDGSIPMAIELLENNNFFNYSVVNISNNTGCGQGRTLGFRGASGNYIKNLDSDDTLPSDFVESINAIIMNSSPDIISYGHNVVDEEGNIKRVLKPYKNKSFIKYTLTMFWRYVFKKDIAILANVDTCGMHYGEDRVFSLTMLPYINDISIIQKQLYNYYKISNSTTNIIDQDKFYSSNELIFSKYKALYNNTCKEEKKYVKYAITKFYVSILAMNCKGKKDLINEYFKIYKELYLNALSQKRYKGLFIIPKKSLFKETMVIQIAYFLLKFRLKFIFKFIFKNLY